MPQKKPKPSQKCPPQLFGIYEDAIRIGATSFLLEALPPVVMASFSVRYHAQEIDFEFEAGREMIDYLLGQPEVRESRRGHGVVEYRGQSIPCLIEVEDVRRDQERIRVSWSESAPAKPVQPLSNPRGL